MKPAQRSPWIAAGLAVLAGTALGEPQPPDACRAFASVPADSTSTSLRWAQQLSRAACRDKIPLLQVSDAEAFPSLVASLENHAAPSIELYRDAGTRGSAAMRIVATYHLGLTYLDIAVRARSAIRVDASYGGASYGNTAYYDELHRLHAALEPLLANDLRAARAAFDEVGFLAEDYPIPAHANDVVVKAVDNAEVLSRALD